MSIRCLIARVYAQRCQKLRRNPGAADTVVAMEFLNRPEHRSQREAALVAQTNLDLFVVGYVRGFTHSVG
jgi:hypothetical protein